MNIRCINPENYKLTRDKVYPAAGETRDYYMLLNDNNVGVRYSKRLFELVHDEAAAPVAPPPPPVRTEQDVINSIVINNGQVVFNDMTNTRQSVPSTFNRYGSEISCGVNQTAGINAQIETIDQYFDLDQDDFIAARKAIFRKCIEQYVIANRGHRFALLSTNVDIDPDMLEVLDELAVVATDEEENPNSGNNIKVWVLRVS